MVNAASRGISLDAIPDVFDAAQKTANAHRRGIQQLFKIFTVQAQQVTVLDNGARRLTGEKEFMLAFRDCVDHLLDIKKGVTLADRVVKFTADFLAFALEQQQPKEEDEQDEDTPASRLVSSLLKHLLKGFPSANKHVRYRCTQLVAYMMSAIPELDEDLYNLLKSSLLERVRDREPHVRVQAIIALAKLQNATGEAEDVKPSSKSKMDTATKALVDAMAHDTSAQARRAALFQLDLNQSLLPAVIARARDVDINNRRYVFQGKLTEVPANALTKQQRNAIIKAGLKDREAAVQKSASRMVTKWAGEDLVAFLSTFDLVQHEDLSNVEEAVKAVFVNRLDLLAELNFDETFWSNLTPETIFLARVTIDHYRSENNDARMDEVLPVATALAYRIESAWIVLKAAIEANDEAEVAKSQFILQQLLEIGQGLDFSDEMGRRRMMDGFVDTNDAQPAGIRAMVSDDRLPLVLMNSCFDLLKKLVSQDSALIQLAIEIVQMLREEANIVVEPIKDTQATEEEAEQDSDDEADEIEEALRTPTKKNAAAEPPVLDLAKKDVHIRCLTIIRCLLERVISTIRENPILRGVVHEVIVPSVRAKEADIRELGIVCLGLCSMLDKPLKEMAIESFGLFVNQALTTEDELQQSVYKIIFDLLMLYGTNFLAEKGHGPERIVEFVEHALEQDSEIQTIATLGLAKLLLSSVITDSSVLSKLVIVYFAPETADNQELRQCLTYFFPVYCYSSPINQRRMQSILLPTLKLLTDTYEDAESSAAMVPPAQMASQLIDWTDPRKVVESEMNKPDMDVHADLCLDVLKELYIKSQREERKRLCANLAKLYLPEDLEDMKIRSVLYLISIIQEQRPLADVTSKNALNKFEAGIRKAYGDRAVVLGDNEHAEVAEFHELTQWLQGVQDDLAQIETSKRKSSVASKKRTTSTTKGRTKRSTSRAPSDVDTQDESDDEDEMAIAEPTDSAPRRSSRSRKSTQKASERQKTVQAKVRELLEEEGADEDEQEDALSEVSEGSEESDDF